MDEESRKEIKRYLKRRAREYLKKRERKEILLNWLDKKTNQHKTLDDYILSIQHDNHRTAAVLEYTAVLISCDIIR